MLNTNRGREYPITVIQKANAQKCIQIHASDITWRTMMCDIDSVYYAYIFVSYKNTYGHIWWIMSAFTEMVRTIHGEAMVLFPITKVILILRQDIRSRLKYLWQNWNFQEPLILDQNQVAMPEGS